MAFGTYFSIICHAPDTLSISKKGLTPVYIGALVAIYRVCLSNFFVINISWTLILCIKRIQTILLF